eukprot:CAMPEP_0194027018 /NCGR_PEP_ID=MMETSP0009_2-20130614/1257_1 /TAXON_ID=210454 /ORGANISM="Grammatophora oceanica, Strain CCMP 410" /LENGTH=38 /DNA_ID= /DNA_START= /DNA_END= /DNA_ORIENTATION=
MRSKPSHDSALHKQISTIKDIILSDPQLEQGKQWWMSD